MPLSEVRWSECKTCRGIAIAALLCIAAGPLSAHFEWVRALTGFTIFAAGLLLGVVAFAVTLLTGLFRHGRFDPLALFGTAPALAFLAFALVTARHYPRINDITTDRSNPPQFVHAGNLTANRGRDLSYPGESFAREQERAYPHLLPLRLSLPPKLAFERALTLARQRMADWEITYADPTRYAFEGVATTRLFRFRDDFVVEVRPVDSEVVEIHMRSKSRDGRGDLGANAKRIEVFFRLLASELRSDASPPL
jgi:uncharacterized protein (DUF1499 family)